MIWRLLMKGLCLLLLVSCASSPASRLPERFFDSTQGVIVVAHRACWHDAPENSFKAIEDCIALGVDMVEIDVRCSADNVLVLMHDETLERTTSGAGKVAALTFRELRQLQLREGAGGAGAEPGRQRIPTFRQALAVAKGKILVNVDAKQDVFAAVMKEAVEMEMEKDILLKMEVPADHPNLRSYTFLKKTNFMPKITEGEEKLGLLVQRFAPYDPVAFEVKAETEAYLLEGADDIAGMGARLWVNTLSATPEKAAGHIDALAVNDPDAHWGRLIELGVNILQTDEPQALLRYLEEYNLR